MPERDPSRRDGPPRRDDTTTVRQDDADPRTPAARLADHAAIDRLASDLLPALVARLSGTGLGELEVREGEWRVRLRRPATGERRPVERSGRSVRAGGRDASRDQGRDGGHAAAPGDAAGHVPGHGPGEEPGPGRHAPVVATSPAVGIFRARGELRTGARVRAGERLAIVDLLGVPQDVTAPGDAVVAALFVEDGDAVEYGQALLALEPVGSPDHDIAQQPIQVG